jgi:L-fuconolactonase
MPNFGIVDTHLHLWDPRRFSYDWVRGNSLMDRPYLTEDYRAACGDIDVTAMVFVECFVRRGQFEAEVRFVEEQALRDPRIKAIIAQASLEEAAGILPFLEHLKDTTPLLRGIRRVTALEPEFDFCLRPAFIEGVKLAGALGLSVDLCVNYRQMEHVPRLVDLVGNTALMLDHCGKPAVREGLIDPWRRQMHALAAHPNVMCKLSGLPRAADHQIRPFIEAAVEAFGFERLVYGGDWPACLPDNSIPEWVTLLDRLFSGVSTGDLRRFYRDNAINFYRLCPSPP